MLFITTEEAERRKEKEENRRLLDEKNIKALLKTMSSASLGTKGNMSSAIGAILQSNTSKISQVTTEYEEKQAAINEAANKKEALKLSHQRTIRSLNTQLSTMEDMITRNGQTMQEMRDNYSSITEEIDTLDQKIGVAHSRIQELEEAHKKNLNISAQDAHKVEKLVTEYDSVVKEKEAFTKDCKEQVKQYRDQITDLKQKVETIENNKRTKLVHEQYKKDKTKLDKLRLQVAKKNYSISALQRQVDDIPSRIELLQYQKRFEELHQQTGAVHTETKQFYSLFNNLSDTKTYLEKHLVRLNSINENFKKAIVNVESGFMFLEQFEQIVEGAKQGKLGIEKKRAECKATKDKLNDEYLQLVEEGRRYHGIVKEFQEECKKTEMLVSKCKDLGI